MSLVRSIGMVLLNLGWDPRGARHVRNILRYNRDRRSFISAGGKIDSYVPMLADYSDSAGVAKGHYFHQDLLVSRFVFENKPKTHYDIGSRIDGFVAHVASFREINVIDIRPLAESIHSQIKFMQCNLMELDPQFEEITDSLSCLHALEHFGLGRYGDPINPLGYQPAFKNMARMVRTGGRFYLSVPVGRPVVAFNAHRVFDPEELVALATPALTLERFDYVDDVGDLFLTAKPKDASELEYGCGIFTFIKQGN